MPILSLQRRAIYQIRKWKFNEDLAELSKFDIAALMEGDNFGIMESTWSGAIMHVKLLV